MAQTGPRVHMAPRGWDYTSTKQSIRQALYQLYLAAVKRSSPSPATSRRTDGGVTAEPFHHPRLQQGIDVLDAPHVRLNKNIRQHSSLETMGFCVAEI